MTPFKSWSSPDETYLAIRTGDGTFILPAANPEGIRRLGESGEYPAVDFSSDSKQIAYVLQTESQGYEVIVENVDGSKSGVMYVSNNPTQVSFIPEHDQILVRETGKMLLLSLSNRKEQEITALEGFPMDAIFAPHGEQVLLSYNDLGAECHPLAVAGAERRHRQGITRIGWIPGWSDIYRAALDNPFGCHPNRRTSGN